ncbi:MAG: AAA family ATPase [Methylibium sp.]|nr:AAA family ATPase [Methylibium sp.]
MSDATAHAHNLDVERAILSVCLDGRHAGAWWTVREQGATPVSFWHRPHRLVALLIDQMATAGDAIDAQSVATLAQQTRFAEATDALAALEGDKPATLTRSAGTAYDDSVLASVGGYDAIATLAGAFGAPTGLERNAQHLVAYQRQRRIIAELADLQRMAQAVDGSAKVSAIADQAVNRISEIGGGGKASRTLADCGAAVMDEHARMRAAGTGRAVGSWGLAALDKGLPLHAGRFIVLAADPGGGKTSLSLQAYLATSAKLGPGSVALVNLEQGGTEIASILISREIGVAKASLENGWLDDFQIAEADRALEGWRRQEAYVRDNSGESSIGDICAWVHQRYQRSGGKLHLVVIDYLQIIDPTSAKASPYQTIAQSTRALKRLANRLGVCVLCLAQINREGRKALRDKSGEICAKPEPRVEDLSGSGTIEQDSDAVLLLWNRTPHEGPTASITMIAAKNRGGSQFRIETEFRKAEGQVFRQVDLTRIVAPQGETRAAARSGQVARAMKVVGDPSDREDLFA